MRLNSNETEEEAARLGMFRFQRLGAIRAASNKLQDAMGIEPGARMMGNRTVQLWELPQKPRSFLELMQELQAGESKGQAEPRRQKTQEVPKIMVQSAHETEKQLQERRLQDKAGATPRRPLTRTMRMMPESPAKPSTHSQDIDLPQTDINAVESQPPDTIIAGNDANIGKKFGVNRGHEDDLQQSLNLHPSPTIDTIKAPRRQQTEQSNSDITQGADRPHEGFSTVKPQPAPHASKNSLFPQIPASAQPASPPFSFAKLLKPSQEATLPIYWDWLLSKRVCEWLDDETTSSTQTDLTHIELRSTNGAMQPLRYEAKDFEKIKLTRMTISPEAETERSKNQAIKGAPEQRDWFIFEIQHKNIVLADMEVDEDGLPLEEPDRDPDDFPEDYWLLAIPVCAVKDTQSTSLALEQGGALQTTAWLVGQRDFVPSMHGREVSERFAEAFIDACTLGTGVVEFASVY